MNWKQAISKASSRLGRDGEAKRMQAYSKMITVATWKLEDTDVDSGNVPMIV